MYFCVSMKHFAAICLSLLYLAMVSGVVVNIHYCMGKVASVALGHSESDRCGDCGMDNKGCCKDEVKVVKVDDTHSFSTPHFQVDKPVLRQASPAYVFDVAQAHSSECMTDTDGSPPHALDGRSRCILHRVFRI